MDNYDEEVEYEPRGIMLKRKTKYVNKSFKS